MTAAPTIVLVGHCGPDAHLLKSVIMRALPGVPIVSADDAETLEQRTVPGAILLVNRVLDGDFSDDQGIELIRRMRNRANPPAMMMISNYESAQAEAVGAGAMPGFGKSKLHQASTMQLLRELVT